MGDGEVSTPPRSALRAGLGEIAMEGKMMRKTMEKTRGYDVKQWEKNGKTMETLSRTLGKLIKTRRKNGGKNGERVK